MRAEGIAVEPRPLSADPGHAELPDLHSNNRKDSLTLELPRRTRSCSESRRSPHYARHLFESAERSKENLSGLQVAGTDLGYRFGWYIRGPYSTTLTQDAFTLKDEIAVGETDHLAYRISTSRKW